MTDSACFHAIKEEHWVLVNIQSFACLILLRVRSAIQSCLGDSFPALQLHVHLSLANNGPFSLPFRCAMPALPCSSCAITFKSHASGLHTYAWLQGYDQTIGGLITVMVLLCVGILVAGIGVLALVASEQHFARPLSYHLDIDQRYQ